MAEFVSTYVADETVQNCFEEGKTDKAGQFYGDGSRMVIMKEAMDCLASDSISVIGLCGMSGIGKTMLAREIAKEVKNGNLFDKVAFVAMSRDQNVKAFQIQLAWQLDIMHDFQFRKDIQSRATCIYQRFMYEKKKILLILDGMWEELNLRSIGIPIHGDRKGFKILFTSRYNDVCSDMNGYKRLDVGILSKEETCILFKMTAEISGESISQIAEEVSQECAGLPLAIVTVGKSLRDKKEHAFRDMLRKLREPSRNNSSINPDVLYKCIKSSYDYLESDEHRSILLLCSIFPEDYEIQLEDLVRYARGLFDTFETMAEARDRVEAIVDELMKGHLLLPGDESKCVKLHDVVHEVCLSIASESSDVHILLKFDGLHKLLSGLKSQRLRLLRLVNTEDFHKSGFLSCNLILEGTMNEEIKNFEEMEELKVLEMNDITIHLPPFPKFMINLHTPSLDYCRLHGGFAGIKGLKMLRVLSFFHSIVEVFPTEISELTNLQCLDLRFKLKHPSTLSLSTLSSLKKLEELYLGDNISGDFESLKEVRSLSKLHTIQFKIKDDVCFELLLNNVNLSELVRFHFAIYGWMEYQIKENVLNLWRNNIDLNLVKALMPRVELFDGIGLTNIVVVLGEDSGSQNLKDVKLDNCDMKYLVDATKHISEGAFSKLEALQIGHSSQLEELIHGDDPHGMRLGNFNVRIHFQCPLGNLKTLMIMTCGNVKSLFSKSMVNCLVKLESIFISSCHLFETIVRIQRDDEVDFSEVSEFLKLKSLTLLDLPVFRNLSPGSGVMAGFNQVMLPKLEDVLVSIRDNVKKRGGDADQQEVCFYLGSSLPKVRYLCIRECNNLLTIAKSGLVNGFQYLERVTVSDCLSVEAVFDFEEIMGHRSAETEETTLLDRLEELDLGSLPKLEHIWRMLPPKGTSMFRNLKNIHVKRCSRLRYLLTPTITKMLLHLEKVKLEDNELMEAIVGL